MIEYDRFNWWKTTLSFRGTALPRAYLRIAIFTAMAGFIQSLYQSGAGLGWITEDNFLGFDPTGHAVLGTLLGFLIVFRMNASNNRYWEGRSLWGQIINCSRNLVRFGCEHTADGHSLAQLVSGYVICLRRSLQGRRDTLEANLYLSEPVCRDVEQFGNIPTGVAAQISHWIGSQYRLGKLDTQMVRHMEALLSQLVDAQGGCEKIQKTPLPFPYVVMVKQLIVVYVATLPLVLCERCGWWSPMLTAIVSLGLFGMEEASVEIEDPFGTDENCLDMDAFTITIARDTGQLAAHSIPSEA